MDDRVALAAAADAEFARLAARHFDESKYERWDKGTRVEGPAGGGRFKPHDGGRGPSGPRDAPTEKKPKNPFALKVTPENAAAARKKADRLAERLKAEQDPAKKALLQKDADYWAGKASRLEDALKGESGQEPAKPEPKPKPKPAPEPTPPAKPATRAELEQQIQQLRVAEIREMNRARARELNRQWKELEKQLQAMPKFDAEASRQRRQEEQDRRRQTEDLSRRVNDTAEKPKKFDGTETLRKRQEAQDAELSRMIANRNDDKLGRGGMSTKYADANKKYAPLRKQVEDLRAQAQKLRDEAPKGDRWGNMGPAAERMADRAYEEANKLDRQASEIDNDLSRNDPARAADRVNDALRESVSEEDMMDGRYYDSGDPTILDLIDNELRPGLIDDYNTITIAPPSGYEVSVNADDAYALLKQAGRR